jgi:glycogen debranching enzyme
LEEGNPAISREAPFWIRQLVLAADQFIVSRPLRDDPTTISLIAGYHWFGDWARDAMLGKSAHEFESRTEQARSGFQRFWSESHGFCFDVIDGPDGNDASLRPNQLFLCLTSREPAQARASESRCGRVRSLP